MGGYSWRIGLGLVVTFLGGCAGGPGPDGPEPAHRAIEGLTGRSCHYIESHDRVPAFREIVRVGTTGNLRLWGDDLTEADSVELSIRYGEDGRAVWVEAIDGNLGPTRVNDLERLILESLEEYGPPDWGLRVTIVGGRVATTAPSVICDAEYAGGNAVWSGSPYVEAAVRRYYRGNARFPVRVALDERGRVLRAALVRPTASRVIDQYILDVVRTSTFRPRLHDGMGVPGVLEFHLRIDTW